MNDIKTFKAIDNKTTRHLDGTHFTISATCDDDGTFEIHVSGSGGKENALKAICCAGKDVSENPSAVALCEELDQISCVLENICSSAIEIGSGPVTWSAIASTRTHLDRIVRDLSFYEEVE